MITFYVTIYLLIAVYVGQSVTILGWYHTKWDRLLDYCMAVFWLPTAFVAILVYILEQLSSKRE